MKGFIVYSTYDIIDNSTIVQLFGRLENGQSFVTTNTIKPYFFIKTTDAEKIQKYLSSFVVEHTKLTTFKGELVTRISANTSTDLKKLHPFLKSHMVETYEEDIKPHFRFLIDNNIQGTMDISGDYTSSDRIDRVYKEPTLQPVDYKPKLKTLSIDTESDKSGKLFCIGLYSEGFKKNFMITDKKLENTVLCKNIADCLEKFKAELIRFDPDIITGWNVIDFDLVYLKELFKKNKIQFDLGRTEENTKIRVEENFFRSSSVNIPGRQVLDGINLIKDPFIQEAPTIKHAEYETYTLEEVSLALLGETKLITGKDRHIEIERLYNSKEQKDQQKLVDYNLMDCKLAYDILINTDIDNLIIERSQLTGLPLDRITASIAAFDSVYIKNARAKGFVSPTTRYTEKETRIKGGYVFSSKAGIFHNVLILDFKSLYPSIIKTFNIDPASYLEEKEKNAVESPNHAYFKNTDGVLPEIIERLHQAREKAKKEKRELASYAIKTTMNSFFGVLASPNCRYFNLKMANAITHFGQMIIKLTAEEIEKIGYKVIYSDTDSVFVETSKGEAESDKIGAYIEDYINNFYQEYVQRNYNRKSFLELQFAKQYLSLMIPNIRNKEDEDIAAKKRYAGLIRKDDKEKIEVTGLEAIRGDWTDAAQEFQMELLKKVFHKEPVEDFIKKYVKDIKEGKLDKKLVYTKSIRKSLDEYTKTTPPHVKAARKLDRLDSNIIQYFITLDGPEPIQKLIHKIDYDHYIEKQIKPIANQILSLLNKSFDDILKSSKQATLF